MSTSEHIQAHHLSRQASRLRPPVQPPPGCSGTRRALNSSTPSATAPPAAAGRPTGSGSSTPTWGVTGRTAAGRPGFQELVALVTLARWASSSPTTSPAWPATAPTGTNSSTCAACAQCLVGDQDGVYDPATANGRLILGLKGLDRRAGAAHPPGPPDRRPAQQGPARGAGPDPARPAWSATRRAGGQAPRPGGPGPPRAGLRHLPAGQAGLPGRAPPQRRTTCSCPARTASATWPGAQPTIPAVPTVLKNPAYAGAFVYGRTRAVPAGQRAAPARAEAAAHRRVEGLPSRTSIRPTSTGPRSRRSRPCSATTTASTTGTRPAGVPRPGKALLHGLVYCGECGHKMVVQYKGGTQYLCNYLRQQYQVPVCQCLPADAIDAARRARPSSTPCPPAELDLYDRAVAALGQDDEQVRRAQRAATGAAALPGPAGRAAVPPGRPGQPPGGRRTGAAVGGWRCGR